MSTLYSNNGEEPMHTDDMQDIITTMPSWIIRWGITIFLGILVLIISLSIFINYPDVINTQLQFCINHNNQQFYGEIPITQNIINKVKVGQQVLIGFKGYSIKEYRMTGNIKSIADTADKYNIFICKVGFQLKNSYGFQPPIHLRQGMVTEAEIIIQNATFWQRISRSLFRVDR